MKLRTLLHSLLLALLVMITGCSVSNPQPAPYHTGGFKPSRTQISPARISIDPPMPDVPAPTVKPISPPVVPASTMKDKLSASMDKTPAPPAVAEVANMPAPGAPPLSAEPIAKVARHAMGIVAHMPSAVPKQPIPGDSNTGNYTHRDTNPAQLVSEQPVSTFSIDVDLGSYTNVRRMLNEGWLPPADAVRAEEFINHFDYGHTPPANRDRPFSVTTELAPAPWKVKRQLLLVGIRLASRRAVQVPLATAQASCIW